jgi:NTE family protein
VGLVAFEIARRHRFHEEIAAVPAGVRVHVLPSGGDRRPPDLAQLRYRDRTKVAVSIERAYAASAAYLARLTGS